MKILEDYFNLQDQIYRYFRYQEDWVVIPINDARQYFWRLNGEGPGKIRYAETKELLDDPKLNYFEDEIYTQRFLDKWVYRGKDFTMICVDTRTDGNKFLQIFDNLKEV